MKLLKEQELQAISDAINAVEQHTDAELVTVLARQADDYRYIPTLWAAVLALLAPGVVWLSGMWLGTLEILLVQLSVFFILALVLRLPFILFRIIPASVRYWRASNLARRQFLENNLHHTNQDCGVLIFVSEAEQYVEILADRGIDQHVSAEQWQVIVDDFIASVKQGNTQQGFIECINACGKLLAEHAPATAEKNELPNHLVVI
ncbi:TPM domain-containing protein [Oceanicoccus sp. KOV_DT_Chl]|uniref:TPM domain-containing protein n=1 Tax=Oceanicoccus sp. KOV_DT_Chl TaxID=1904639 RepID=UPI000C7B57F0|nr:TPM domain-containing protein [Oceanicoccus sp. KOV_DT_Chl]